MIKLNLGCGNKIRKGWVNVDFPDNYSGQRPDVCADLRKLPFDDGYADLVEAVHVLEHFLPWEFDAVLDEWVRVLKPGGALCIEVPCLDKILTAFQEGRADAGMFRGLYGDWTYKDPRMLHRWCFSVAYLKALLEARLDSVQYKAPLYHRKDRDMRFTGVKRGD